MPEPTKPSQQFVEIKEIKNDVVYLKSGGLRKILIVSGVNFDLKSENEQTLILNGFRNFLNTLDFSVQLFIHSRKTNIDLYLEKIAARKQEEKNELLKIQIEEYIQFIRSFVEQNAIISKTFFVIVPYDPVALPSQTKGILSLFKKTKPSPQKIEEEAKKTQQSLEQLNHRVDQVTHGLEQVGLRTTPLNDEELIELFYNLYNPQLIEKRGMEIAKK